MIVGAASPMPWWEVTLTLLVVFVVLVVRFVPLDEWAKWRSWFVPYGHRTEHKEPGGSGDADDFERDQPQDPA